MVCESDQIKIQRNSKKFIATVMIGSIEWNIFKIIKVISTVLLSEGTCLEKPCFTTGIINYKQKRYGKQFFHGWYSYQG